MSVTVLFKRLSEIEAKMEQPALDSCVEQLDMLDRTYDETWKQVLSYSPQNADLAELMLLLLLDKMAERTKSGESVAQIREKIFDLFQTAHERVPPVEKSNPNYHRNAGLV